ncbi:MAG: PTS sugar transporter subunit IIA [Planctomycetaceae bacterium]|nr:PTS sugar transporter subunit IIA [Planctomycetaceae bacterium]
MSHEPYTIDELARQLGRDRREIEKLVQRGRIPGRKVGGEWLFHPTEITHWLEQEMRAFTDQQLEAFEESQQSGELDAELPVTTLLHPDLVQVPMPGRTKRSVLENLIEVAGRTWQIWEPATVLKAVQEREDVFSTADERGIAIPHPRNPLPDVLGQSLIAFGRTESGIPFGGTTRGLTDLFILVACRDSRTHLHVLARLGRILRLPGFLDDLRAAPRSELAYEVIRQADETVGRDVSSR